jgi:hypothetical protein
LSPFGESAPQTGRFSFLPYNQFDMAQTAIWFGLALILLGVGSYTATGAESPTALIPAVFGILLSLLGFLARNPARRKLMMHIAAAVGVLGFFGSARGLAGLLTIISGEEVARPTAVFAQSAMALLCLAFIFLCVRSFVNARRSRLAEGPR